MMYFLIGVILLILFIIVLYIIIMFKIRRFFNKNGFSDMNLKNIVEEARIEDQEVPKSLASMDRIYLKQIQKDFPELHINELKRESEEILLQCFSAIEKKNFSNLKGKIRSFCENFSHDYDNQDIHFKNLKIHNTVVSNYGCDEGVATIYFSSSFEYFLDINGISKKVQDRVKTEFIYVMDASKISKDISIIGIHCPNCGSPVTSLGEKKCSYCGSAVL